MDVNAALIPGLHKYLTLGVIAGKHILVNEK
jgi:hypothetical protein